ncbi:MAG: hypothetical protein WC346_18835 [Methanogenium sp.]|jgi:hypothetical protein
MKEFNVQNLLQLKKDLSKALAEVEKQHNIKLEIGTISYMKNSCSIKISSRIVPLGNTKSVEELEYEEAFNRLKSRYGLEERKIGDVCNINGEKLTLIGIAYRRKKYPIVFKDSKGKIMLFTQETIHNRKWE